MSVSLPTILFFIFSPSTISGGSCTSVILGNGFFLDCFSSGGALCGLFSSNFFSRRLTARLGPSFEALSTFISAGVGDAFRLVVALGAGSEEVRLTVGISLWSGLTGDTFPLFNGLGFPLCGEGTDGDPREDEEDRGVRTEPRPRAELPLMGDLVSVFLVPL